MIYTVTLNPAIDYVVRLDGALHPGGVNRSAGDACQFGGKGVNVSNVLRALGNDTTALGFVAGFTGEGLENGLRAMGLNTDFIHLPQGLTRINVKIRADAETEINGAGPAVAAADLERLAAQLDRLDASDSLVLSGSIPASLPDDTYAALLARLAGRGVRTVVDAEGRFLLPTLQYRPFLVKPNQRELGAIFGKELRTEPEILGCARRLQQQGARNVLVSMAGAGALLLDENGAHSRAACPQGTVVNSVGAGDAMVAGFLAGYLERRDYRYALKLGIAAGSATAFSIGLADKRQIEALLEAMP